MFGIKGIHCLVGAIITGILLVGLGLLFMFLPNTAPPGLEWLFLVLGGCIGIVSLGVALHPIASRILGKQRRGSP